jgi:hypothetical protein
MAYNLYRPKTETKQSFRKQIVPVRKEIIPERNNWFLIDVAEKYVNEYLVFTLTAAPSGRNIGSRGHRPRKMKRSFFSAPRIKQDSGKNHFWCAISQRLAR